MQKTKVQDTSLDWDHSKGGGEANQCPSQSPSPSGRCRTQSCPPSQPVGSFFRTGWPQKSPAVNRGQHCPEGNPDSLGSLQPAKSSSSNVPATTPRPRPPLWSLKCAAWNIKRGFVTREAELKHLIDSECLDIISISEADLYYQTEPPRIDGFKSIPTKRSSPHQKVRLLTLVKNSVANDITVRLDLMSEDFPSVWIEVQGLLVGSIYREWGKLQDSKLEILLGQIQAASSSKKDVIVMGDFNIDQLKWDNPLWKNFKMAERLRDVIALSGLEPIPMGPTYQAHQRSRDCLISTRSCLLFNQKASEDQSPVKFCIRSSAHHG
jgi:hypothetical protein